MHSVLRLVGSFYVYKVQEKELAAYNEDEHKEHTLKAVHSMHGSFHMDFKP